VRIGSLVRDISEERGEIRASVDVLVGIVDGRRCPSVEIDHRNLVRRRPSAKRARTAESEGKNDHEYDRE
jgi:hypothetical protein